MSYVSFVWKPSGYELHDHEGQPPGVGEIVEEDSVRLTVTKVAPSPLPGDTRRCVYLQPADA